MYCRGVPKVDARMFKKREKQPIILSAAWISLKATWSEKEKKKPISTMRCRSAASAHPSALPRTSSVRTMAHQ
jgi:hypothetical protein